MNNFQFFIIVYSPVPKIVTFLYFRASNKICHNSLFTIFGNGSHIPQTHSNSLSIIVREML